MYCTVSCLRCRWPRECPSSWSPRARNKQFLRENMRHQKLDSLKISYSIRLSSRSSIHTRLQAPRAAWALEPEAGWRSWQTPLHHLLEVCSSCLWPEPAGPPSHLSSSLIHTSCFPLWASLTVSLTWWSWDHTFSYHSSKTNLKESQHHTNSYDNSTRHTNKKCDIQCISLTKIIMVYS